MYHRVTIGPLGQIRSLYVNCCFTATFSFRLLVQTVDDHRVKVKLDTMLKKWKPREFKPKNLDGTISARVR